MPTPGLTHHLTDLLGQLSRLSTFMRAPATADRRINLDQPLADPANCIKIASWRVADYAFFHHVDLLRPYVMPMPWLAVDEVALTSVISELLRSAIEATASKGAVVCISIGTRSACAFASPTAAAKVLSKSCGGTGRAVSRDFGRWRSRSMPWARP